MNDLISYDTKDLIHLTETKLEKLFTPDLTTLDNPLFDELNRCVVMNEIIENGARSVECIQKRDMQQTLSFLARQICSLYNVEPRKSLKGLKVGGMKFQQKGMDMGLIRSLFGQNEQMNSLEKSVDIQEVSFILGEKGVEWRTTKGQNLQALFKDHLDAYHDFMLAGFRSPDVANEGKRTLTDTLKIFPEDFLSFYDILKTDVPELTDIILQAGEIMQRINKDSEWESFYYGTDEEKMMRSLIHSGTDIKKEAVKKIISEFQKRGESSSLNIPEGGIEIGIYILGSDNDGDYGGILKLHPDGKIYSHTLLSIPERHTDHPGFLEKEFFALQIDDIKEISDFRRIDAELGLKDCKKRAKKENHEKYKESLDYHLWRIKSHSEEESIPLDIFAILDSNEEKDEWFGLLDDRIISKEKGGLFRINIGEAYDHLQHYLARKPYVFDEKNLWISGGKPINSRESYLKRIDVSKDVERKLISR